MYVPEACLRKKDKFRGGKDAEYTGTPAPGEVHVFALYIVTVLTSPSESSKNQPTKSAAHKASGKKGKRKRARRALVCGKTRRRPDGNVLANTLSFGPSSNSSSTSSDGESPGTSASLVFCPLSGLAEPSPSPSLSTLPSEYMPDRFGQQSSEELRVLRSSNPPATCDGPRRHALPDAADSYSSRDLLDFKFVQGKSKMEGVQILKADCRKVLKGKICLKAEMMDWFIVTTSRGKTGVFIQDGHAVARGDWTPSE